MLQRITRMLIILWIAMLPCKIALAGAEKSKTLGRTIDQVVLTGRALRILTGLPIENLSLIAYQQGNAVAIPFQIDERTPKGKFVFENADPSEVRKDDGKIDENDDLVFMAADTGDRPDSIEMLGGSNAVYEIRVSDPLDQSEGYVYLYTFDDEVTPPHSETDYVSLQAAKDRIIAKDYIIAYDPKAPISLREVVVQPSFGAKGYDVGDRLKIRVKASSVLNLFSLDRNEEDFKVETVAYTDGPVRVLRHTRAWQVLFFNIPTPSSFQTSVYYRNQMQFPITIDIPFDVSGFFKDVSMRVSVDTPDNVPGLRRYYNNHNPKGVDIDGKMSEAEKNLDHAQVDWQVIAGTGPDHPEGWFSRQSVDSDKGTPITLPLYYVDDMSALDPPENIPGSCGNLGFEFQGLSLLKKGTIDIEVKQFPLLNYQPGDEQEFLNVDDNPLLVDVSPVNIP